MNKYAIAIHGGAGDDSAFIQRNLQAYKQSLSTICSQGHAHLKRRTSALDTVFEVLALLEDDPLFNAGRGSSLNEYGRIEMDAAVMDGKSLMTGGVSILESVKNPSRLVKEVLKDTNHILIGGHGAQQIAVHKKIPLEPESYFVTEHQVDIFLKERNKERVEDKLDQKVHGTVGVVACDHLGNIASGVSSGGTEGRLSGRIGDSSVIGAGCYANNKTCAVSCTGDGEYIIQGVIAHYISCCMEFLKVGIQEACDFCIHEKHSKIGGNIGVIGIDREGNIGISFNSERMLRAWVGTDGELNVTIYPYRQITDL